MSQYTLNALQIVSALLLSLSLSIPVAQAGRPDQAVAAYQNASGVSFSSNKSHSGASLTVTGPNGYFHRQNGASIAGLSVNELPADGLYKYEITLQPTVERKSREGDEMSMQHKRTPENITSGAFRVLNGAIINSEIQE